MTCGLSSEMPIGLVCALKDIFLESANLTQTDVADYAQLLRSSLLRPVFSPAAQLNLRLIGLVSGLSILVTVLFWLVLLHQHYTGVKPMRWLLPVDCGAWGIAHLPEPRLAWTIPMAIASAFSIASCADQQDGHDPLDPVALNGLITLLFCMAAWLQFPGAVYQSYRLRFGRLTVWINLVIWGTISMMFASLNTRIDDVILAWHRFYNDGIALHDALLESDDSWIGSYASGYSSYTHELDAMMGSAEVAAQKISTFNSTSFLWLALIAAFYVPIAVLGLIRPRTRPPTPGLGLDFGTQQQSLKHGLDLFVPTKTTTIFEDVEVIEDEDERPSYARQARIRLAIHFAFSLVYGSIMAICFAQNGSSSSWIWQSTIVPGWTHAVGATAVNLYLLITTIQETPARPSVQLASPQKKFVERTPRAAFEVSTPSRQQMRAEMQRTPSIARITTPRRRNLSRDMQFSVGL